MFSLIRRTTQFRELTLASVLTAAAALAAPGAPAQTTSAGPGALSGNGGLTTLGITPYVVASSLEFVLKGPDGAPIKGGAVITLFRVNGSEAMQLSTNSNSLLFPHVPQTEYRVQIAAPFYRAIEKRINVQDSSTKMVITLEPLSGEELALAASVARLPSKAQKNLGKAIEALRANNPAGARGHLDALMRVAPQHAEVNYLYGLYASETNNEKDAIAHWSKALEADPRHLRSLLSLSEALLRQNKTEEAAALAKRAVAADPSSWRAQALLAGVAQQQNSLDDVILHAQRALELGHSEAFSLEPMLAEALARRGEKNQALILMESYLKDKPSDEAATKELAAIRSDSYAPDAKRMTAVAEAAGEMPLGANWLPPDVDEKMPPVQSAAACSVSDVVTNAGKRVSEFIGNLEKFTATESLVHQTIDKWGVAGPAIKRKFDYLAAVQEVRPQVFNFDEYRRSLNGEDRFPEGIATDGLPALVMIFHPYYASTFEMNCEGLASWEGRPVWQVHFRQRPGAVKTLRSYKLGLDGPSHSVALRGRAWIAADTFQIVRLETDLVKPLPAIRLRADHTIVEYSPVAFKRNQTEMWLPRTAEVYFDWLGHRMHRVHSFSNYLLFAIDDKQKISAPKNAPPPENSASSSN